MSEYAPLEAILRLCAAAAPVPWYPKRSASELGLTEADLAAFVEQLRSGGLISRTDAIREYGRGYVLTPAGMRALQDAGDLEWLRRGHVPPPKSGAAEPGAPLPEREQAVRMSLLAPFSAYVTYGLIALNVAIFLWGVYLGQRQGIRFESFFWSSPPAIASATGAVRATDVLTPGWGLLRLLTCCFVHFGLVHVGANMLMLYLIGPLLERMWGHVRFLVLYLVAGFGGSCVAVLLRPVGPGGAPVTLAGASGAIWGILAGMAVWLIVNYRHLPRRLLSMWGWQIAFTFIINIVLTYKLSHFISAEAHYGGGVIGAVCALLLHLTRFGPVAVRAVAAAAVAALPIFGIWAVMHPERFNAQWAEEEKALQHHKEVEVRDRDDNDMQDRVMPQVRELEKKALQLAPDALADPVINRHPTRRDPDQVKKAIEAYTEAEAVLRPAVDLLRQAGPYGDEAVEKARQVRLKLVEARLNVFALNKRCLEAGEDWHAEEKERLDAISDVRDREKEWRDLLR
jgi:membrane associated rhomboid family serine protease